MVKLQNMIDKTLTMYYVKFIFVVALSSVEMLNHWSMGAVNVILYKLFGLNQTYQE